MKHYEGPSQLRIGEFAARAGVNAKTIRYYESIGLLPAPRRSMNGYRVYPPSDASRLLFIRRAQSLGLSLAAIQDILALQDSGQHPCQAVQQAALQRIIELNEQISALQRLWGEVQYLAERASQTGVAGDAACEFCPAIVNLQQ